MDSLEVFNWKICGVGGSGLQAVSNILGRTLVRGGYSVHVYDEFPSIIKGGLSTGQVAVSSRTIRSHRTTVQLLVCLTEESIKLHAGELSPNGWLVYDSDVVSGAPMVRPDVVSFGVPLTSITREIGAERLLRNTVALGVTLDLLGYPLTDTKKIIAAEYEGKGHQLVEGNYRALAVGAEYAHAHAPKKFPVALHQLHNPQPRMLIPGNDALSIGALAAGCSLYVAYPMTPSSSILTYLVKHGPDYGMVVRQLPDEIAVINQAIGASFAGVRAMVGTSGGGFSLMVEGLGLAAMTETPLVIINAQRPGPSTGLPTWTEQADLRFVMHASQGDFPRVVLAPGDPNECFTIMPLAFNIADRYQTPVIVLTDKYLAESWFTTEPFSLSGVKIDRGQIVKRGKVDEQTGMYRRYADAPSGVSPRPLPGTPGLPFMANSDEHDQFGLSNEEADVRITQQNKRLRKIKGIAEELPKPSRYGPKLADLTVICWGSSKGPVLDALDLLAADGLTVNAVHVQALSPFPTQEFRNLVSPAQRTVVVEGNAAGQFAGLALEQTGIELADRILRFDGRPFEPTELADAFRQRVK
ncbi:MAG: 2-oxoacid:acceptor oxidoreductase subunit alpha [Candidatus Kerfeldbacteria bacterium]|nr:2-oxoacid:acceptor oxidoreductase subunit alpha [Candidatus Kerfeldbacteria bacterium]